MDKILRRRTLNDVPLNAEQIENQKIVWSVLKNVNKYDNIINNNYALDKKLFIKHKAIAILQRRYPVNVCKLKKNFRTLQEIFHKYNLMNFTDFDIATNIQTKENLSLDIRNILRSTKLIEYDTIYLPIEKTNILPFLLNFTEKNQKNDVFKFSLKPISNVSLFEFENFAFNNNVLFQYYEGVSFSSYFVQNTLHMFNVKNIKDLEKNEAWQAKLTVFIDKMSFNDSIVMEAFYNDIVTGIDLKMYNVDFVPKYDVIKIKPKSRQNMLCSKRQTLCDSEKCVNNVEMIYENEMRQYWLTFDEKHTKIVPKRYLSIFYAFPFKNGHYVRPNGRVVFIDFACKIRKSVDFSLKNICSLDSLYETIENISSRISLNELVFTLINSSSLIESAIAMMVLRNILKGNDFTLKSSNNEVETIKIPLFNEILKWLNITCLATQLTSKNSFNNSIILPKGDTTNRKNFRTVDDTVSMIKDIVRIAKNVKSVDFICSSFMILECDIRFVYEKLTSNEELYVFYTLLMQNYNNAAYNLKRKNLTVNFNKSNSLSPSTINVETDTDIKLFYEKYKPTSRPYVSSSYNFMNFENIQQNKIVYDLYDICDDFHDIHDYVFLDKQLEILVNTGNVQLSIDQFLRFILLNL